MKRFLFPGFAVCLPLLIIMSMVSVVKGQNKSSNSGIYVFAGGDLGFSWLDFPFIQQAVKNVNSDYHVTEVGIPLSLNAGFGYKTYFQVEYRIGFDPFHDVQGAASFGNNIYGGTTVSAPTIENLHYSFQEFLFKGSFISKKNRSLYLIIGYNNSKIDKIETIGAYNGFKGGGLTTGIELAYWNPKNDKFIGRRKYCN